MYITLIIITIDVIEQVLAIICKIYIFLTNYLQNILGVHFFFSCRTSCSANRES